MPDEAIVGVRSMRMDRREFLAMTASGAGAQGAQTMKSEAAGSRPAGGGERAWNAQWIWYPGQLAAHRHSRRMRLSMERCTHVGYPANYRQPLSEAYFRKTGTAASDIALRWAGPTGRIRVATNGRGGDITARSRTLRAGPWGIEVQIDFAAGLPCLLMEGGEFSTGASWEASLDGEHWVAAETGGGGDPTTPPDAERELTITLEASERKDKYAVGPGRDVVVDFRETELGQLRFDARGRGELTVQVGESVAEVNDADTRYFEQYALPGVTLGPEWKSVVMPERGMRYARFAATGEAEVSKLRFDARLWPAEERGRFESSDVGLNAIWRAAVATLRSNMHDFYLDGIRRDGLVWHDGPLTLDAYERVFADADLSRQTLIAETLPARPAVRDVGIIDAPMYTVIAFEREWLVRGDPGFARMFRGRIEEILEFYASLQDARGFVDARRVQPYGYFPDWSASEQTGPDSKGAPAYGQMLLAGMFASGAGLARAWGDAGAEEKWRRAAAKVRGAVREAFWRPGEGVYVNGLDRNGKLDERVTPFAQAFAVMYGTAEPAEFDALIRRLDDEAKRPAQFSLSQVVELTAYAKAGRAEGAVSRLRRIWGPMLRMGYRRFFEDIHPTKDPAAQLAMYGRRYANSLCHAWAGAAPVMALSRGVLGVEPLEPGYRVCEVKPQPCGLEWVKGSVPAPGGPIEVEWKGTKGEVRLPGGVSARIAGKLAQGPGRFDVEVK